MGIDDLLNAVLHIDHRTAKGRKGRRSDNAVDRTAKAAGLRNPAEVSS